jgi:DNA adenine methylase
MANLSLTKWAGGKGELSKLYNQYNVFSDSNFHVEPFLGGGGSFLYFNKNEAAASDVNPDLVNLWQMVRDEPEDLINQYESHAIIHSIENYNKARQTFNEQKQSLTDDKHRMAGLFLYLMKTSFNGLCRYNLKGNYNVPIGDKLPTVDAVRKTIEAVTAKIENVQFDCCDFADTIAKYKDRDNVFFYCDPPYSKIDGKGFQEYAGGRWSAIDADRMAYILLSSGCKFAVSEVDTAEVRSRYPLCKKIEIMANRSIGGDRAKVKELLILSHS